MSNAVLSCLQSSGPVAKKCVKLNNGVLMPIVGFGTYKIQGSDLIHSCLDAALKAGYRLIDTAAVYGNEEDIGKALEELLPKHNLKREDIFITSKLAPTEHGDYDIVSKSVQSSLKKLRTPYIDLYLVHWPGFGKDPADNDADRIARTASWAALSKIYKEDKTLRAIGISNYAARHINQLLSEPNAVVPVVNQIEFHPWWQYSDEFHALLNKANIVLQAYFSLGGSDRADKLLLDPTIKAVAEGNKVTAAKVLLRWALQRGFMIIPKSVTAERIRQNIELDFSLPENSMKAINDSNKNVLFGWDPDVLP